LLIDNIKTGDRVEITQQSIKHDVRMYITQVEAVMDRQTVLVYAPISLGEVVRLPTDSSFHMQFISDKGIFRFNARIDAYVTVENFEMIRFNLLDKGKRTQRRDFFRFNCAITVTFAVIDKDGEDKNPIMIEGLVRDLGGGGMKMYSAYELKERSFLRIMLQLDNEYIMIFGEVLHKVYNRDGTLPFQYGVKFAAMSKTDQEKIIQFLYMEQRKSLQRAR
jgi:c-di-GMP-binding flagellar brake protein YcgR